MTPSRIMYRGYHIYYDPPPVPTRQWDWHFYHDDYDPTPEHLYDPPSDHRNGDAPSILGCMAEIDMQIEEAS